MTEKSIYLKSPINLVSATVNLFKNDDKLYVSVRGKINFSLNEKEVIKGFLISCDNQKINLGVIDVNYTNIDFIKELPSATPEIQSIHIIRKDTYTEEEECIAKGDFQKETHTPNLPDDATLKNASAILDNIKNALETNDRGISKRNCINAINKNLRNFPSFPHKFRMFDTFFECDTFTPIIDLSSVKHLMFEKLCAYSFHEAGHYLISTKNNLLIIAFREYNNHNPLSHMGELSFGFDINSHTYYGAIIELDDEGQYFIN